MGGTEAAVDCVQRNKHCLHLLNIFFALFASVLGMAASASYSNKKEVIMNVPYTIQPSYTETGTKDAVLNTKYYFGLSGYVYYNYLFPPAGKTFVSEQFDYAATYQSEKCGTSNYKGVGQYNPGQIFGCDALSQCATVGKVSMAFVILGFIAAIISAICSKARSSADSWTKKMFAMLFSLASMLCSLIALLSFGACARWVPQIYNPMQDPDPPASCLSTPGADCGNMSMMDIMYPGPGSALSITSLVLFIVVFALNVAIPSADAKQAAEDAGLPNNNA